MFPNPANVGNLIWFLSASTYLEKIEDEMADKQNAPRFDESAIRAKWKKVKGVKVLEKDNVTSSNGSKRPCMWSFFPLQLAQASVH